MLNKFVTGFLGANILACVLVLVGLQTGHLPVDATRVDYDVPFSDPAPSNMYEYMKERTVKIYPFAGYNTFASGFIINKAGYIMTAAHVVSAVRKGGVVDIKLADDTMVKGLVTYYNRDADVAIIHVPRTFKVQFHFNPQRLDRGDSVHVMGHPHHRSYRYYRGTVKSYDNPWPLTKYPMLFCDIKGAPGMSGGPLVDDSGRVVGILQGGEFAPGKDYTRKMTFVPIDLALKVIMVDEAKRKAEEKQDGTKTSKIRRNVQVRR